MGLYHREGKYGQYRENIVNVGGGDCVCIRPKFRLSKNLNEGVTKTYPTKSVLKRFYTDKDFQHCGFKCFEWNDNKTIAGQIVVYVPNKRDYTWFENELKHHFESFGYYLSTTFKQRLYSEDERMNINYWCYQFEPRYQYGRMPKILGDKIYHITTKNGYEKIKRFGFSPRSNCVVGYEYPERVYFFTVYNEGLFKQYIIDSQKSNKKFSDGELVDTGEYVILTIDLKKVDYRKVQFFTDPNVPDRISVFTGNNISKDCIVNVKEIKLE